MANFNKVLLIGNLTRDPELRYTPKGTAIAKLGLAVNRGWRDEAGNLKEEVTFVDVEAFGRQAETLGQYLKKGQPLFIEGRLRLDTWEDKQTSQKRSRLLVVLENFQFFSLGNRATEEGAPPVVRPPNVAQGPASRPTPSAEPPAAPNPSPGPSPNPAPEHPAEEDDVPF